MVAVVLLLCLVTAVSSLKQGTSCTCHKDLVRIDDWILVFRVQADNRISAYQTWMNDAVYHDNPIIPWMIKPQCTSLRTSPRCHTHFKSRIVPMWEQANIKLVKVLLLKDSQKKAYILFNGIGSTKTSWFSRSRVINSTWSDLKTAPSNIFSIAGHQVLNRRFFMSSIYNGCAGDYFWMDIIDNNQGIMGCAWDKTTRFPKIIYSIKSTAAKTDSKLHNFEYADGMAVLVKLGQ
ncbi:uncharacterized protein LOC124111859 isoform X1 [Haliotis rufescens]|uniref:uncharacterized protein LOC124111859 isoform X1 n=1 Tax=Haliotis rufescens TaxID=6454 RepID=UPI00201F8980|nr:uncharacterized protein LOC124111859 isoform X1 [Haliotis rufescens]